jgi:hypothetical protein
VRTFAEASVLLFLAVPVPVVLLGYLIHPGIYRAGEAVIVGLCGRRARVGRLPPPTLRRLEEPGLAGHATS